MNGEDRIVTKQGAKLIGAGLVLAIAIGTAGFLVGRAGHDRIAVLERRARTLERNSSAIETERNRIRAERDRLEARLAAQNATPKACPDETLSTADAHLVVRFAVDYPCGWSVLEDPLQSPEGSAEREGLMLDALFFSALPISRAPREGPLADITLDSWYDDVNAEGDRLPALDAWVAQAQKRFSQVTRSEVRTRGGLTIAKLAGSMTLFDEPRPALLYVWEWTGSDGIRKISEAFALDPGKELTKALETLVLSFRVLGS